MFRVWSGKVEFAEKYARQYYVNRQPSYMFTFGGGYVAHVVHTSREYTRRIAFH